MNDMIPFLSLQARHTGLQLRMGHLRKVLPSVLKAPCIPVDTRTLIKYREFKKSSDREAVLRDVLCSHLLDVYKHKPHCAVWWL